MKSYLIIINNAPKYYKFYKQYGDILESEGNKVSYAFDSEYSLNQTLVSKERSFIFTSFIENDSYTDLISKYDETITSIINEHAHWPTYPDFDRNKYYSIFNRSLKKELGDLLEGLIAFYCNIFNDSNYDFIIYENESNALATVARVVGEEYGVKYIGLGISRLPGRSIITSNFNREFEIYLDIFNKIENKTIQLTSSILDFSKKYIENIDNFSPDYMKNSALNNTSILKKYFNLEKIKIFLTKFKYSLIKGYQGFQVGNPFYVSLQSFIRNLKRSMRLLFINKIYVNADEGEKYILYPLHYHPEASTSVLSKHFTDELNLLEQIAFSLPRGYKLYVKDHVSSAGYLSFSYMQKINALPNTKLISYENNTKDLIKNSEFIICLTSTVGFESLLLNKKVICFGNPFYSFHKNCFKISSFSEIQALINNLIEQADDNQLSLFEYNLKFISAYYLGTLDFKIDYSHDYSEKEMNSIKEKIDLFIKNYGNLI